LAAEVVGPRRHAERRDGVGDQHDPAPSGAERQHDRGRGDVVEVGDQSRGQAVVGECSTDHTGVAVAEGSLRVVEVGDEAGTGISSRADLLVARVGVPDGDPHAGGDEVFDRSERPVPFRREGEVKQRVPAGVEEGLEAVRVGVAQQPGVVGAAPALAEERPLHVDSEGTCAPRSRRTPSLSYAWGRGPERIP
jgi:hypothetical protein